jgi:hypothetical protein
MNSSFPILIPFISFSYLIGISCLLQLCSQKLTCGDSENAFEDLEVAEISIDSESMATEFQFCDFGLGFPYCTGM